MQPNTATIRVVQGSALGTQLWERGIGESIGNSLKGTACGRPLEDGGVCNHPAGKGISE